MKKSRVTLRQAAIVSVFATLLACGDENESRLNDTIPSLDVDNNSANIVGGTVVTTNAWPWNAYVRASDPGGQSAICSGVLISSYHVLTDAHCTYIAVRDEPYKWHAQAVAPSNVWARVGSDSGSTAGTTQTSAAAIYRHPSYAPVLSYSFFNDTARIATSPYDVAIIEYATAFTQNPATIASRDNVWDGVQEVLTAIGWGNNTASSGFGTLRQADLEPMSFRACNTAFGGDLNPGTMCATHTGRSTCGGDSGGPLIRYSDTGSPYIIGITESGAETCDGPSVFTRTESVLPFVALYSSNEAVVPLSGTQVAIISSLL